MKHAKYKGLKLIRPDLRRIQREIKNKNWCTKIFQYDFEMYFKFYKIPWNSLWYLWWLPVLSKLEKKYTYMNKTWQLSGIYLKIHSELRHKTAVDIFRQPFNLCTTVTRNLRSVLVRTLKSICLIEVTLYTEYFPNFSQWWKA